ncbi:MAG TPA: hypothetical protein VEV17_23835 [Bryobacteraceae bacterium]|nr:hypothetical protein [Bryobacteraceae bacterium]
MIIRIRIRRRASGARFVHPMDPVPRTAILSRGFEETKMVRVFPRGWDREAARFRPTSIAAPVERLRSLVQAGLRLEHAVIAFTYQGQAVLSHADRDLFWRAFGVPVFEQYLGRNNELLATECDAHSGLHVVAGCSDLRLEPEPCPCGDRTPRLARGFRVEELVELLA